MIHVITTSRLRRLAAAEVARQLGARERLVDALASCRLENQLHSERLDRWRKRAAVAEEAVRNLSGQLRQLGIVPAPPAMKFVGLRSHQDDAQGP